MRATPTVIPVPVATIFSFGRGGNESVVVFDTVVGSGTGCGPTEDASGRIPPTSTCVDDNICASLWGKLVSDTELVRSDRGVERPLGEEVELTAAPRRRNRLAFSRDPASFLNSEPRRLCSGNCAKLSPTVLVLNERFRFDRLDLERRRLDIKIGKGSGAIQLLI